MDDSQEKCEQEEEVKKHDEAKTTGNNQVRERGRDSGSLEVCKQTKNRVDCKLNRLKKNVYDGKRQDTRRCYELWKEFGKSKWNRNSEHAFIGTGVRSKLVEEKGNGKSAQTKKSAFEDERK